jgi:hypothetical protein
LLITTSAPAPGLQRRIGQRIHGGGVGHVAGLRQAFGAAGAKLGDHDVQPLGMHVGQQQPRALRGQVAGQRLTDAGGGPGDHHALAFEGFHGGDCGTGGPHGSHVRPLTCSNKSQRAREYKRVEAEIPGRSGGLP